MPRDTTMAPIVDARLLDELTATVSRAAAAILAIAAAGLTSRRKADSSPVTAADEAAEAVILGDLSRLLPGVPVAAEEACAASGFPRLASTFVLVDPLDGTREILAGRPEYTVNIAIVTDGNPVLGIVAAPALGLIWRGIVGHGAERLRLAPGAGLVAAEERVAIHTRAAPDGLVAALSRSHLDPATTAFVERLPIASRLVSGSSVKFCRLAEGTADVYPRLSPTSEWDIAAGQAVLVAAGGMMTTPTGDPVAYGRADQGFLVPGFLAWGDRTAAERYRR